MAEGRWQQGHGPKPPHDFLPSASLRPHQMMQRSPATPISDSNSSNHTVHWPRDLTETPFQPPFTGYPRPGTASFINFKMNNLAEQFLSPFLAPVLSYTRIKQTFRDLVMSGLVVHELSPITIAVLCTNVNLHVPR